jgi:hypothetical protein
MQTQFLVSFLAGVVILVTAARVGRRIWPIWLIGLPVILVITSTMMGIPWAQIFAGEAGRGAEAGGLGLGILFFILLSLAGFFAWSFTAVVVATAAPSIRQLFRKKN